MKMFFIAGMVLCGCLKLTAQPQPLFQQQLPLATGVFFSNRLPETPELNIITYEYFYNGGGVGVADFNKDGKTDIYLSSNVQPNKLYLNKGNWQFEDATRAAGVAGRPGWKTGVSIADVNGDGWPDIYQCYSGDFEPADRKNQLFINNKNGTFSEQAAQWGIADEGYTTQAAFFDYDRDGDLDLYVLNHNIKNLRNFDAAYVKKMVDPDAGDRLYRNDGNKFTDVSREAGIISNPLGYGLGIAVSDLNGDGWPDLYISNDYVEEDYLYINNGNGTFSERLKQQMGHISNFSMGSDIADINNDALPDVFTLDMLPADNKRQKLLYAPDNYEVYNSTLKNGFYHQLMRNMLHINNGNNTFSEIGQVSGVSNTDWSWSALFADFTNSGRKDLMVTNGYGRDMINRDFMKFYADERLKHLKGETDSRMFRMLQGIKTTPLTNYFFQNIDGIHFKDRSAEWGFTKPGLSHGAAYADLDNDGDLDLVINNMNDTATLFRNYCNETTPGKKWLDVSLHMQGGNTDAIGAKLILYTNAGLQMQERFPARGFQSSMLVPIHFAWPATASPDSLLVVWPDGKKQIVKGNALTTPNVLLEYAPNKAADVSQPFVKTVFRNAGVTLDFRHVEQEQNDFKIQPLMPNMISYQGPCMAKADVNGDGLADMFMGGASGQAGALFVQQQGKFILTTQPALKADADFEDVAATFFDADNDKDMDLLVVSGGFRFPDGDSLYRPRLYINQSGKLVRDFAAMPDISISASCIAVNDFNADGWQDVFIGARVTPWQYPQPAKSLLLENNQHGKFSVANELEAGLVTDALWIDLNTDGKKELLVSGEWMPIEVYEQNGKTWSRQTQKYFQQPLTGWWNKLNAADLDKDGDLDLVAGNWGMNSQLQPNDSLPVELYYGDFDDNGNIDPLLCYPIQGKNYPMASRDELTDQIVSLRQRFPTYDAYSEATITDILNAAQLSKAKRLTAAYMRTCWFENVSGKFLRRELPAEAQFTPVYAIAVDDFNHDGFNDILLGGNVEKTRIKIGKIDAGFGTVLLGSANGKFTTVSSLQTGLKWQGCIRDIEMITVGNKKLLVAAVNNGLPLTYEY